jgi:hypothetical protein
MVEEGDLEIKNPFANFSFKGIARKDRIVTAFIQMIHKTLNGSNKWVVDMEEEDKEDTGVLILISVEIHKETLIILLEENKGDKEAIISLKGSVNLDLNVTR